MSDIDGTDTDDATTQLPPLENWASQTFAYGWILDRSQAVDYTNSAVSSGLSLIQPTIDDIHLLNLNPQEINEDEPIATDIAFSQRGGKVIESKGGIIKSISVRGTTGFLPPIASYAKHMVPRTASLQQTPGLGNIDVLNVQQSTGFYEFYRLRQLFRRFMKERREGRVINMHWCNFKANEFWLIEPKRFGLSRTRFSYTYNIQFDCIEPSEVTLTPGIGMATDTTKTVINNDNGVNASLGLLNNPLNVIFDSTIIAAVTRLGQLAANVSAFLATYALGAGSILLGTIISNLTNIEGYFANVPVVSRTSPSTALSLYKDVYNSLQALSDVMLTVIPSAFQRDVNDFLVELQLLTEGLISHHQKVFGSTPGQAMSDANLSFTTQWASQGTASSFIQEQSANSSSPTNDPFLGGSGFSLIGDLQKMISVTTFRADKVLTNENIWDVAQRTLGDANRFIDLVVFNELRAPYVVSDPNNKPPGTIAWGEPIFVPTSQPSTSNSVATPIEPQTMAFGSTASADSGFTNVIDVATPQTPWRTNMWTGFTVTITSGTQNGQIRIITSNTSNTLTVNRAFAADIQAGDSFQVSLITFNSRKPVTPETAAFGRDILAVFQQYEGLIVDGTVDCMMGPQNDLATVAGLENLAQAITLRLQSPPGSDKSNPTYGTVSMIGRAFEPNIAALHVFYVRQSLLNDPRIAAVLKPSVTYSGTALTFSCYVQPVRVQKTLFFSIPLG